MRALHGLFALLFLFGAAVQFNDPDPLGWAAIYLAAAINSGLAALGRAPWIGATAVLVVALAWAATLAPAVVGKVPFSSMFGDWEMAITGVEESREMYGLVIIAAWMAVVAMLGFRRVRTR